MFFSALNNYLFNHNFSCFDLIKLIFRVNCGIVLINKFNKYKNIMAGSLNKVLLIGRLGADPEIKQMVNGKSVARLSLATSQSWKDKNTGEKKEKTEWHRIVVFNEGLVNVVQQYLKKGAQIYVEGQLTTRKWKDEQSGQDKYSTEIVIQGYNSSLTMLGGGNSGGGIQNDTTQQNNIEDSSQVSDMDDEIPF